MNIANVTVTHLFSQVVDETSFAPFGQLVRRPQNTAPNLASGAVESWLLPFTASSTPQIMFNRYRDQGREFSVMERHHEVSQCFFPLGEIPYIMVVGKQTSNQQPFDPENVKAFYIPGGCGVLLWKNVWHSLARFPVSAEYIDFAFITDLNTQNEIEEHLEGGPFPKSTDFIDFTKTHQTRFVVNDPQ